MHIAYVDESGNPHDPATTHYVLVAVAIPAATWKAKDEQLQKIKNAHRLGDSEVHTAWMIRSYPEQERIAGFAAMTDAQRQIRMKAERKVDLGKAALRGEKAVKLLARNYEKTKAYVHLTRDERGATLRALADAVGAWEDCRLFGDVQQKAAHIGNPERMRDFAFEQVVTRFQTFLGKAGGPDPLGLIVHDQNETVSLRLTKRMRSFHKTGTTFAKIPNIVETPLFVDSELTSMVQVADLVGYGVRKFVENKNPDLLDRYYGTFDRQGGILVGLRHYTGAAPCVCRICVDHGRKP
jgi:hypothetical protein